MFLEVEWKEAVADATGQRLNCSGIMWEGFTEEMLVCVKENKKCLEQLNPSVSFIILFRFARFLAVMVISPKDKQLYQVRPLKASAKCWEKMIISVWGCVDISWSNCLF